MYVPETSYDILIIDDEPALLNLAKIYLEMEPGFRIGTATSALKGLKLLASQHYDAVISDFQMPGMDGIELLKELRTTRNSNVPFILFTGRGREDVAIAALNNGADFYIQKGGEPQAQFAELRNAVLHAIQRKGAEELVQNIVDNAPMMIMIVDADRRIQTFNNGVLEFTKLTPPEIIGLRCGVAFNCRNSTETAQGCGHSSYCDDCKLWQVIRRTIETGQRCLRVEAVIQTPEAQDYGVVVLMVSTAPIRSYGKNMALVFLEDFTAQRKCQMKAA